MRLRQLALAFKTALLALLGVTLLGAYVALAQTTMWNLRATAVTSNSIKIKWENGQGSNHYLVFVDRSDGERVLTGYRPRKLMPLLSFERNGMTCGLIERAGTAALLHKPMPLKQPIVPADPVPAGPAPDAPVETVPALLEGCQI